MALAKLDDLGKEVQVVLSNHIQSIQAAMDKSVRSTAKACRDEIASKSPKKTGAYADGWKVKVKSDKTGTTATVYNADRAWLTHLLEFGHGGAHGTKIGAAPAHPHIRPAVENAEKTLTQKIKEGI